MDEKTKHELGFIKKVYASVNLVGGIDSIEIRYKDGSVRHLLGENAIIYYEQVVKKIGADFEREIHMPNNFTIYVSWIFRDNSLKGDVYRDNKRKYERKNYE